MPELVNADAVEVTDERRRQFLAIDSAYRAWCRNRADVDALRALQAAILEQLAAGTAARVRSVIEECSR